VNELCGFAHGSDLFWFNIITYPKGIPEKAKSSSDKSEELECFLNEVSKADSNLSFPDLRRGWIWHLVPIETGTGCQGFIGPLPSAFLDKRNFKERAQR
jgi:hypothetical protein